MTEEFGGTIGRTYADSAPWWPPLRSGAGRCAERRDRAARRRRVRAVRVLRVRHRDAVLRRARERRAPVRELPHDRVVLADARVSADRPEPPLQRHGSGRRARRGLPRVQLADPEGERLPLRDPRSQRLRHVRGREVAPHARRGDDDGQPARSLAARSRVRAVLRLHGRRDRSVPSRPRLRQPSRRRRRARRRRATTSPRISPTRRSCSSRISAPPRRTSRSSSGSHRARATRRTRHRPSTSSGTAATSTRVGTNGETRCSRARSSRGCCRR